MSLKSFVAKVQKQNIIYWKATSFDGYGSAVFAAPVQLVGRWDDKSELYRDKDGREVVSKAKLITPYRIYEGDFVKLGTKETATPASPIGVEDAFMVNNSAHTPDIKGRDLLYRAYI